MFAFNFSRLILLGSSRLAVGATLYTRTLRVSCTRERDHEEKKKRIRKSVRYNSSAGPFNLADICNGTEV